MGPTIGIKLPGLTYYAIIIRSHMKKMHEKVLNQAGITFETRASYTLILKALLIYRVEITFQASCSRWQTKYTYIALLPQSPYLLSTYYTIGNGNESTYNKVNMLGVP